MSKFNRSLKKNFSLEFVRISLALFFLILIFFSGPLLNFANTFYSPVDMLQSSPVFAINSQRTYARNGALGDDIYAYLPWIEFSWRSLRQGEFPLWNPYNAGGRPLLANMQSSIFYPSQWPGFFFGPKIGLLARCFLHLYLAGLGAYYFFRSLKLLARPSLIGATAFMFGGMMMVWLYNEVSATFLLFPALLLVLERRLSLVSSSLRFSIELSLVVMLQIFGGHPETIFMNIGLATLYLIYRLATDRVSWSSWSGRLRMFGLYCVAGLWGVVLGAIQLFPFLEYLFNSASLAERSTLTRYNSLQPQYLLSFILPDPFGNPSFGTKLDFTNPNYSEVSGSYIGPTVLFLAILALWLARHKPIVWFFGLVSVTIVQIVYNLGPLAGVFIQLQPVSILYNRLGGYAGFCLIVLMVFALDSLLNERNLSRINWRSQLGRVLLPGALFGVVFSLIFWWLINSKVVPFDQAKVRNFEIRDFLIIGGLFLAGLGGAILFIGNKLSKQLGLLVLIAVIFGQLALFGSNYRAGVAATYFYPNTEAVQNLVKAAGRVAPQSPGLFPAEANIWYGLEQVNGYDSLEVRWFEQLRKASIRRWPNWDNPIPLTLFNIKTLLTSTNNPDFRTQQPGCCPELQRTFQGTGLNIFTNLDYQPVYRLIDQAVSRPEQTLVADLLDGRINTLDTVAFIDGLAPSNLVNNPDPSSASQTQTQPVALPPPVKIMNKTANRVSLEVENNPRAGYLYIDQTYFPGWKASVNGQPAQLYRANVAFTALPVSQGKLNIELVYNPGSFRLGMILTILGLLITFGAANYHWFRTWLRQKEL